MNEKGIVRNVDDLGRIVVPKEIRRVFEVAIKTPLEFFIDETEQRLVLKKYNPGCS